MKPEPRRLWRICAFALLTLLTPLVGYPSTPTLDGALNQLIETYTSRGAHAAQDFAKVNQITLSNDKVRVEFWFLPGQTPKDVPSKLVQQYGAAVASESKRFLLVDVPINNLASFAGEFAKVAFLHRPYRIYSDVVSEGLALVGGVEMHGAGITGRNLDVGIIDLGFGGWEDVADRQELPMGVQIENLTNENINAGSDHGTACAEIVYDFASGSQFHFIKIDDAADLENAIGYLIENAIPVASMSLAWFVPLGDYYRGDDQFSQLINDAADQGLLMVKSAGNYAKGHFRADFSEQGNDNLHHFGGQTVNNFGASVARPRNFQPGEVIGASLVWDAFPVTALDYDLELVKYDGQQWQRVAISDTRQNGNQPPVEELQFTVQDSGNYGVRVRQVNGNAVNFTIFSNYDLASHQTEGSIAVPAMAARALTTGAVNQFSWNRDPVPLESYSSRGPTYDDRIKPDLVAPDAVSTLTLGNRGFSGTSASTPHTAGAAMLIKSVYRNWTGDQIKEYLISTAIDVGDEGADNSFGAGKLTLTLGAHPEGQLIQIPMDVPSIAYAIQIADSLDTILVHPGTYYENLNTNGKTLVIGSLYLTTNDSAYVDSTIIDGSAIGRVATFNHDETRATELVGFTLMNGQQTGGNGVFCNSSSPTIRRCKIVHNVEATRGGGISIDQGEPLFIECEVSYNSATDLGGGIMLSRTNVIFERCVIRANRTGGGGGGVHTNGDGAPVFRDCIVDSNQARNAGGGFSITTGSNLMAERCVITANVVTSDQGGGGGVYTSRAVPVFDHCTFSKNIASSAGAIRLYRNGNALVTNSILWGNEPNEISMSWYMERNQINVAYSNVEGGRDSVQIDSGNGDVNWQEGNLSGNPLFANADAGDLHLTWANYPDHDATQSPCIDAGDPAAQRDPDSTRADMGVFYFLQQAQNAPNISVEPDTLWFTNVVAGDTLWKEITIYNFGDQTLVVRSFNFTPEDGPFGIGNAVGALEIPPSESSIFRVFFHLVELPLSEYAGTLVIASNDPDDGETAIALRASVPNGVSEKKTLPLKFGILGLSPNPFNATTILSYELTAPGEVHISIYDISGRRTEMPPALQNVPAGRHEVVIDAGRFPAGLYLVRLEAGGISVAAKAVILK